VRSFGGEHGDWGKLNIPDREKGKIVDAVLTIGEVGQMLRRSIWFVQGEIAAGRLKHARVGGFIRVTSEQLADYLQECSERGQEKVRARKAQRAEIRKEEVAA
jgi:hypothetical protein